MERDLQLKVISDYNLDEEEKLRRMDWYNFNFHLRALKRRSDAMEQE